jgi:hypothetical protein
MKKRTHVIQTSISQALFAALKAEAGQHQKYSTVTKHILDILMHHTGPVVVDYTYKTAGAHKVMMCLTESEYNKIMADFQASGQDTVGGYVRNVLYTHFQ